MAEEVLKLPKLADEESSYVIRLSLYDESVPPELVTPNADLTWTLTDLAAPVANVINSRLNVSLSPTSTPVIVLTGEDLSIGEYGTHRQVLVKCTYASSLGTLYFKKALNFDILPLVAVP